MNIMGNMILAFQVERSELFTDSLSTCQSLQCFPQQINSLQMNNFSGDIILANLEENSHFHYEEFHGKQVILSDIQ